MNNLKCSFCQQELKTFAKYKDGTSTLYCSKCNLFGDSKLFSELIRTRKALDVVKRALQELKDIIACPPDISYETGVSMYADGALQEITALEQKDVK